MNPSDSMPPAGTLKEKERIDDLGINGYRIIQKTDGFCFGMDAVFLSSFAAVKEGERVMDFGTGTGIIPILLAAKTKGSYFAGLEIQAEMAEMAQRSVKLNGLNEKVHIFAQDIREAGKRFAAASFDVVTANPPYMKGSHGLENPHQMKAVSRHEILCTMEDVAREAGRLLKPKGRLYLVHRPRRMVELLAVLTKYRLEPKRIRFVHSYADKEANLVLIEAAKDGGAMVKIEAPIVVYEEQGKYSAEFCRVYGYQKGEEN